MFSDCAIVLWFLSPSPLKQRLFSETEQFYNITASFPRLCTKHFNCRYCSRDTIGCSKCFPPELYIFVKSCRMTEEGEGRKHRAELPLTDFVVQLLHVWDLRLHSQVQPLVFVVSRAMKTASRVATIARAPSLNCVFDWQRKNLSLGVNCGSVNTIYNPNVNRHLVKRLKSMNPSIAGGSTKHISNNEFCLLIFFLWTVQIFKYLM